MQADKEYFRYIKDIMENGDYKGDRTGTGTKSKFGSQMRFNLEEGFPLLTTKATSFRLIASELLWFLKGDTNIKYLLENNNNIWNEWAFKKWVESEEYGKEYKKGEMDNFGIRVQEDKAFKEVYKERLREFKERILGDEEFALKYGDLGNVYGKQWRSYEGAGGEVVDQIAKVIEEIKRNPNSRRLIVSAWNPTEVDKMALPPCHTLFQFYVSADRKLSCQLYQR